MRRVLVTGATGGLGLATVAAFRAQGYAVRATGRNPAAVGRLAAMGAEFAPAELTDLSGLPALCQGMDSVVHAAALSSPWGTKADFHRINVEATLALHEAAQAQGARFVFVSSPSVYAQARDQIGLTEDSPLPRRFLNAYAASKAEAEGRVMAKGGVAIRPRAIVGPDDTVLLPRFLRLIDKGRFPLIRDGRALVELTDARDVAHALLLAEQKAPELAGQVFNISGGRALPLRDTVSAIAGAMNRPVQFRSLPFTPVRALTTLAEGIAAALPGRPEPPLTVYGLCAMAFSQTFDLTRARTSLGYAPRHDALETAMSVARSAIND
ncbi:NAD-dependent epimerase/dehydratase family protein [Asticcacaulis solisilvae]|uniref:NAD-dependent epimerase/dehydratase family protein n=1 Tax=Asticcacaulis solisilvae TaxID=1217274 RepID=UPI003FD71CFD